ncbi:hypothetical protein MMC30_000403 [Trapelia coarctata]|nr:hypothetical protein [Trapelia coarctata]
MVSLINSNNRAKRRLSCYIDGRETYVNADSGSDLDAMSTSYAQSHGYSLNTDLACKRYIQLADTSIVTSVGQVAAAVTIGQGHSQMTFAKVFDILPDLQSDVLLGEDSLDEMRAFTLYETSFVDRLVGAQHLELGVLINLGPVAQKISKILAGNAKVSSQQSQPSKAKEQDNRDMEEIVRQDRAFTPKQLFDNELHEEMVGATDPTMPKAPITGSKAAVLDEQKRRFEERRRRMDQGEASFRRKIRESSTMMRGGISIAEEQGNSTAA